MAFCFLLVELASKSDSPVMVKEQDTSYKNISKFDFFCSELLTKCLCHGLPIKTEYELKQWLDKMARITYFIYIDDENQYWINTKKSIDQNHLRIINQDLPLTNLNQEPIGEKIMATNNLKNYEKMARG